MATLSLTSGTTVEIKDAKWDDDLFIAVPGKPESVSASGKAVLFRKPYGVKNTTFWVPTSLLHSVASGDGTVHSVGVPAWYSRKNGWHLW